MELKMILSGILIEAIPLDYEALQTCQEKQDLQEKIAKALRYKHRGKVLKVMQQPEFFVDGIESKMNKDE